MISGGLGAPEASDSALTIRLIASSTRCRTASSKVRTLSLITASSGITFSLVPAWSAPTVTTTASDGPTSRETIVCNRNTVEAAITTGSMLACGIEPCAPRPNMRIWKLSPAEVTTPDWLAMIPADIGMTCWPRITSGLGKRLNSPSSIIAWAPAATSSAGWKTAISVPCQAFLSAASNALAPASQVTCMSWPQACITGVSFPSASVAVTVLAYGRPVSSLTGSASMSARSITVGPSPFFSSPTTPVPPTPSVTSNPAAFSRSAAKPAVRFSCSDSSGWLWMSLYSASRSSSPSRSPPRTESLAVPTLMATPSCREVQCSAKPTMSPRWRK